MYITEKVEKDRNTWRNIRIPTSEKKKSKAAQVAHGAGA